jgi:hypothetical protein
MNSELDGHEQQPENDKTNTILKQTQSHDSDFDIFLDYKHNAEALSCGG